MGVAVVESLELLPRSVPSCIVGIGLIEKQVLLNLDWGYDLSHAIEQPRVHTQLLPAYVSVCRFACNGADPGIRCLSNLGYNLR